MTAIEAIYQLMGSQVDPTVDVSIDAPAQPPEVTQ